MNKANKRGVSLYISWILLMLLAIGLSAMMYSWYNSRTSSSVERLTKESTKEVCNSVGISIKNICQNTQSLTINISNSLDIRVNQLIFNLIDLYDEPETKKLNITIYPGETEKVEILKQGTMKQVEITPVIFIEDISYLCSNRKVFKYKIAQC